jgi:hypothetical protein
MKLHKFKTYDDYVEAQKRTTRRKMQRRKRCYTSDGVVDAIVSYHLSAAGNVAYGICHGVRYGEELNKFEARFKEGNWLGTEIVPELCDGVRILNYDFAHVKDGWIGHFDFMYTNSFDHSRDPDETVKIWISCLSPNGRLYIEWTPWHGKLGRGLSSADCFAATKDEYMEIFQKAGTVEHVMELNLASEAFTRYIFVIK